MQYMSTHRRQTYFSLLICPCLFSAEQVKAQNNKHKQQKRPAVNNKHKQQVRPAVKHHWLLLLASFPETLSPAVYADLLPELVITDTPARLR